MDFNVIVAALPEILTQIIGFAAVYFILKKYAFGTVFQVLDERQRTIASSIDDVEQKKAEVEALKVEYEERLRGIEHEARLKLHVAVTEGERVANELREKAQHDAEVNLEYARQEIQRETETARAQVRQEVVELSLLMAGKLIAKNLSAAENEQYILELLSHTGELS